MKTILNILVGAIALALIYVVVSDGMMNHFGLSQSIQFAFNYGAIFLGLPACIFFLFEPIKNSVYGK
jgi:hypothetical protein